MTFISIFNDVLGPVMRGPSSSHTAGSFRIGRLARDLFGKKPDSVTFTFDPDGSYSKTYRQQGVDKASAAGLMLWKITDDRFTDALRFTADSGINISFLVEKLTVADHPNRVTIEMKNHGSNTLNMSAKSVGGGMIEIDEVSGYPVNITGKTYCSLIETESNAVSELTAILKNNFLAANADFDDDITLRRKRVSEGTGNNLPPSLIELHTSDRLSTELLEELKTNPGVRGIRSSGPVMHVGRGSVSIASAADFVLKANGKNCSLGDAAAEYEAHLIGISKSEVSDEMFQRYLVMEHSVTEGLDDSNSRMNLLAPSAASVYNAMKKKVLPAGGLHTRAAARALAVMHVNNSMGVVCAAPTGGAAGVIPAVIVTLAEEMNLSQKDITKALFAAGAVGLITAVRATFAAEVAGCQVEIGAAGAMAAAAVVEAAGGTVEQAFDAAAIAYQNTMGSVCDLVQGMCEIPCHTRNAVAASNAFVCADLILGGYKNPINLDETIDAVYSVGKMLPVELRCTSLGGLALCPSTQNMKIRNY